MAYERAGRCTVVDKRRSNEIRPFPFAIIAACTRRAPDRIFAAEVMFLREHPRLRVVLTRVG